MLLLAAKGRESFYEQFGFVSRPNDHEGCGIWGYGDIFMCGGIDVMPMYFTVEEMQGYLEEFLDHFLQALYAKNDCYFPSRKRTEKAIAEFKKKPADCYERLLKIVQLASKEETIEASVTELRKLGNELKEI